MWELYINSISSDIDGERCASDLAGGEACASRWVWRSVGIDDRSRGSRNHENHQKFMIFRHEIDFFEIAPESAKWTFETSFDTEISLQIDSKHS